MGTVIRAVCMVKFREVKEDEAMSGNHCFHRKHQMTRQSFAKSEIVSFFVQEEIISLLLLAFDGRQWYFAFLTWLPLFHKKYQRRHTICIITFHWQYIFPTLFFRGYHHEVQTSFR